MSFVVVAMVSDRSSGPCAFLVAPGDLGGQPVSGDCRRSSGQADLGRMGVETARSRANTVKISTITYKATMSGAACGEHRKAAGKRPEAADATDVPWVGLGDCARLCSSVANVVRRSPVQQRRLKPFHHARPAWLLDRGSVARQGRYRLWLSPAPFTGSLTHVGYRPSW